MYICIYIYISICTHIYAAHRSFTHSYCTSVRAYVCARVCVCAQRKRRRMDGRFASLFGTAHTRIPENYLFQRGVACRSDGYQTRSSDRFSARPTVRTPLFSPLFCWFFVSFFFSESPSLSLLVQLFLRFYFYFFFFFWFWFWFGLEGGDWGTFFFSLSFFFLVFLLLGGFSLTVFFSFGHYSSSVV